MALAPKLAVTAPPAAPYRYGLQSVVINAGDGGGRFEMSGVEYLMDSCRLDATRVWVDTASNPDAYDADPMATQITGDITWTADDATTASVDFNLAAGGGSRVVLVSIDGTGLSKRIRTGFQETAGFSGIARGATYTVHITDVVSGETTTVSLTVDPNPTTSGSVTITALTGLTAQKGAATIGDDSPDLATGVPFTVIASYGCAGISGDEARRILSRRIAQYEAAAVERVFWEGTYGVSPSLRNGYVEPTDPVRPTGIVRAVAALEDAISSQGFAGVPIIHAPRWVYPFAAGANLIVRDRNVLRTPADTMWAFGSGYTANVGPHDQDTETVDAFQSWLYITGPIQQWRSDVFINPDARASLNRETNVVEAVAERTYVLAQDCRAYATLADLSYQGGGGGGGAGDGF
jgi:hypothetical protein